MFPKASTPVRLEVKKSWWVGMKTRQRAAWAPVTEDQRGCQCCPSVQQKHPALFYCCSLGEGSVSLGSCFVLRLSPLVALAGLVLPGLQAGQPAHSRLRYDLYQTTIKLPELPTCSQHTVNFRSDSNAQDNHYITSQVVMTRTLVLTLKSPPPSIKTKIQNLEF